MSWPQLRQPGETNLIADEPTRARIARFLDIEALQALSATLSHEPWLDGVSIDGRVEAISTRLCGVSLAPFEEPVNTTIRLRLVSEGSMNAPRPEAELIVSLDEDDPPEIVFGNEVNLANYVIETLSLALDPFPRKPGAAFEYIDPMGPVSPFAVLKSANPED